MTLGALLTHTHMSPTVILMSATGAFALGIAGLLSLCPLLLGSLVLARKEGVDVDHATRAVLYHVGRILGYVFVGALFGVFGLYVIDPYSPLAPTSGLTTWVLAFAGTTIIMAGLSIFARPNIGSMPIPGPGSCLVRTTAFVRTVSWAVHHRSPIYLGVIVGILPCVPLMPVAVLAAAAGSPLLGAGFGLIFGLGTLSALLLRSNTPVIPRRDSLAPMSSGALSATTLVVTLLGIAVVAVAVMGAVG